MVQFSILITAPLKLPMWPYSHSPSAPVSVSELMPQCTATAKHPAATSHSVSIPTIPSCAFAAAETLLAAAHADGIHPEPVYTSDHPARSISVPAILSHAFTATANSLAAANTDGIIFAIVPTSIHATAAAPSPVVVPATVDHMSAPVVVIAHLALTSAPTPLRSAVDSKFIPASVSTPLSVPATISASEPAVSFDFPITPTVSISKPAVIFDSVASHVFASTPAPLLTNSQLATRLPIMAPSPNTTNVASKISDVAFKMSTPTYVPQMAPSATVDSNVTCHALGMVFDPGIDFSVDSALSDIHPCPDISFHPFIFQFTLTHLFAVSVSRTTYSSPPSALPSVPQHSLVAM